MYLTQDDLVQGLQTFGGASAQSAAYFKTGGAPRPVNYVMHVSPDDKWHDIVHEYTHAILEEISGNAYRSSKWLDEGLAEHVAYASLLGTRHKEDETRWSQSRTAVVKKALEQGKLFGLASISTESQWSANHNAPELYDLQYAEAYAVVTYLAQKYGVDKSVSILKFIGGGDTIEAAVQKALQVSLPQLEGDFRAHLRQ